MGKKRKLAFLDLLVEASKGGTVLSDFDIREEVSLMVVVIILSGLTFDTVMTMMIMCIYDSQLSKII